MMTMKSIHLFLMAAFLPFLTFTGYSQQNPQEIPIEAVWSIVTLEEMQSSPARPVNPQFSPLGSNDDFRIFPTTNSTQSEMSVAVSPIDNNVVLVSANASSYPPPFTFYGTGVYWSTNGGNNWEGEDIPPTGYNNGDPAAAIDLNGYFYVGSVALNNGQGIMRSTDGGNSGAIFRYLLPPSFWIKII